VGNLVIKTFCDFYQLSLIQRWHWTFFRRELPLQLSPFAALFNEGTLFLRAKNDGNSLLSPRNSLEEFLSKPREISEKYVCFSLATLISQLSFQLEKKSLSISLGSFFFFAFGETNRAFPVLAHASVGVLEATTSPSSRTRKDASNR